MNKKFLMMWLSFLTMVGSVVAQQVPRFSLVWSEYPSWSTFGVAIEKGFIDPAPGKQGTSERKHNVDLVLNLADYDPCLVMYASGQTDMVCITNMDVLNPSLSVPSVAIIATSTSDGADGLIVTKDIANIEDLRGKKVRGLDKTVSSYLFYRIIEINGGQQSEYTFSNMDPGAAAQAMQQKQKGFEGIVVWNPFLNQTLNSRSDVRVLADSSSIPGEIVDMVVMSQAAMNRPGGREAALAIADAFYSVCDLMASPATRDDTLIALGDKFSNLDLQGMRRCVQQTKFYSTPQQGISVFTGNELPLIMERVSAFCVQSDIVGSQPSVAYGNGNQAADLRFDPSIMQSIADSRQSMPADTIRPIDTNDAPNKRQDN